MKTKLSTPICILLFAFFILPCTAQVPESFNYQVVVRDGVSNNPLTAQDVSFRMSILKGSSSGESQYSELHSANTGALGIVNLVIGNGTGKTGNITTIDWGADIYFLKVEIDKAGGSIYVEMGTTQLLSVPYAMHSKSTETYTEIQTIADAASLGNSVNTQLKNLTDPTDAEDAATKGYVDILSAQVQLLKGQISFVKDIEGNLYTTIKIGDQVWLGENLKTTSYNDGTTIPLVTDNTAWNNLTSPGCCWYDNNHATYGNTYGALYNWYVLNAASNGGKNVCLAGWHVATNSEWTTLIDFMGGEDVAGGNLKATGTTYWSNPNTGATNISGFAALPGGYRDQTGGFYSIGGGSYWWSSTEDLGSTAFMCVIYFYDKILYRMSLDKKYGNSVRCIKD